MATDTAAELQSRSLESPVLGEFMERNGQPHPAGQPAAPWGLEGLVLAAYFYHPDLELARAQWQEARAAIRTAGSRANPTLTVEPGYDTTPSGLSPWFPSVTVDVPVATAGKRRQRRLAAELMSRSARLRVAAVAWEVRSRVRARLVDALAARRLEDLVGEQVAAQEQIVDLLDQRIRAGELARSESATERVVLQRLRLERVQAKKQVVVSRGELAEAIGVPMSALDTIELDGAALEQAPSTGDLTSEKARRAALLGRSDVLAALSDYAAALAELRGEARRRIPDVHFAPTYQYDQGDNKWSLGISFEVPVANQNDGPIAQAQARCRVAAARFNALQTHVLGRVSQAVELFRVSEASMRTLQSLQDVQAARMASVQAKYDAGGLDRLDLLNARAESLAASRAQLQARVQLQQAVGSLEDAIQRPIEIPEDVLEMRKEP